MAVELNPADASSWSDWVTNFDATYANFNDNFQALLSLQNYVYTNHPELQSIYDDLVARGHTNNATLTQLKATRDYVWSWIQWLATGVQTGVDFVSSTAQGAYDAAKAALGLSGVDRKTLQGLGIAPMVVIGLAAAAAALVVVSYWIQDAYTFAQRVNALQAQEQQLIAGGMDPATAAQQAQQIVNGTLGPPNTSGLSGMLGIPWGMIILAAVALLALPTLLKSVEGRD